MSTNYVDLGEDKAALAAVLRQMGLAEPGEEPVAAPLTGGVSSMILRIDLKSGSYCLKQSLAKLKVAKDWFAPRDRVFAEAAYLAKAAAILPGCVPRVFAVDDVNGAFVMEYLDMVRYVNWKDELLGGVVRKGFARKVAAALVAIHNGTADDPHVANQFALNETFMAIRLEPYLVETARNHPAFAARLHELVDRTYTTRRVLVHGDVSPKNILISPDERPVLLDAECCWFGDPAFDVVFLSNHFLLKTAHIPERGRDYLGELRDMLSTYFSTVAWEDPEILERRVAQLLPGMILGRVDGKSPAEYLTGAQRDKVREKALALFDMQCVSVQPIIDFWEKEFTA